MIETCMSVLKLDAMFNALVPKFMII